MTKSREVAEQIVAYFRKAENADDVVAFAETEIINLVNAELAELARKQRDAAVAVQADLHAAITKLTG